MRKGIVVNVTAADRACLGAVVANRNSPQKHDWRTSIILLTADGPDTCIPGLEWRSVGVLTLRRP
jgi:hypothetical protein